MVRWSWWASSRPGAIMRSGEQFRATSSRVSFTRPQTAGSRPSGRSWSSTVRYRPRKKGLRCVARFDLTLGRSRQDDIVSVQSGPTFGQPEQGSPCPYLDVIRVRTNGEY